LHPPVGLLAGGIGRTKSEGNGGAFASMLDTNVRTRDKASVLVAAGILAKSTKGRARSIFEAQRETYGKDGW
jgi:hypothetical protein